MELLTRQQVAEMLQMSVRQLDRFIANGLPVVRLNSSVRIRKIDLLEWIEGKWKPVDTFERKASVDKFNSLVARLDEFSEFDPDNPEEDRIRDELDSLWYKEFDSIAEIQADPLRMRLSSMCDVQIIDKKAADEGDHVRFTGQLHDTELDVWDSLNATVSWSRLDICYPGIYEGVAQFWGIVRPQDMEVYNAYHIPREVMRS